MLQQTSKGLKATDQHVITLLHAVLQRGQASRAILARHTRLRPNTVGGVVDMMVRAGWLTESAPGSVDAANSQPARPTRGRPAVSVEVDGASREVLGLALLPHRLRATRVSLLGKPLSDPVEVEVDAEERLVELAAGLVSELVSPRTVAIGVSSPGLVDEARMQLLFSSTAPQLPGLSLAAILEAAGDLPVALENDLHALGDRWRLSVPQTDGQTVVLVSLADGAVGSSIMIGGQAADAGCVRGGNELGHLQVHCADRQVPRCYCGQSRCVERVFSSEMAQQLGGTDDSVDGVLVGCLRRSLESGLMSGEPRCSEDATDPARWMVGRLAEAVANVVNLVRPHRVVWVGDGPVNALMPQLNPVLSQAVVGGLIPVLRDRVVFEQWCPHAAGQTSCTALTAGALGIAMLTGQRVPAAGKVSLRGEVHAG